MDRWRPPAVRFGGRIWSAEELTRVASGWAVWCRARWQPADGPLATVMVSAPDAVALFFALSSLPTPLVLLPADPRGWASAPAIPRGTLLILLPACRGLVPAAERLGLRPLVLPDADAGLEAEAPPPGFLTCPGLVVFTSGSTGAPKPVYRTTPHLLAAVAARLGALGVPRGAGVLACLPLSRASGLNHSVLAATVLGSPLALLPRFEPNAVLALFASQAYHYWAGSPAMADLLTRGPGADPHPAPPVCVSTGRLAERVLHAFRSRFGVPLRGAYSSTETGGVAVDSSPAALVRTGAAGWPLPGVRLRIGDDPRHPSASGEAGRIWIQSPWMMEGYGFPPVLEPRASRDGWWPAPDLGRLDDTGCLTVIGRMDDRFRTDAGYVVDPMEVAAVLIDHPGVTDAVVLPLDRAVGGRSIAALVEGPASLTDVELRHHVAGRLPAWSHPRVLRVTAALPRLPGGKADRDACLALLRAEGA